jgi:septal ring factor EnvC (AmiA/AmiB activator)
MSQEAPKKERVNWKDIEKHLALLIVGALFTALLTGFGFYYNTSNTLNNTAKDIDYLKHTVKLHTDRITEVSVHPVKIEEQIRSIQHSIDELTDQQKELVKRQDRVMEILLQMNSVRPSYRAEHYIQSADSEETADK